MMIFLVWLIAGLAFFVGLIDLVKVGYECMTTKSKMSIYFGGIVFFLPIVILIFA
jgi:hypothetical protein